MSGQQLTMFLFSLFVCCSISPIWARQLPDLYWNSSNVLFDGWGSAGHSAARRVGDTDGQRRIMNWFGALGCLLGPPGSASVFPTD
uniref:Uncharacterized protein n=1 Tax=Plectus sambesii TaxID=2011161 RepID=A0A914XTS9_9BILA